MNNLSVIIADDEVLAREGLAGQLALLPGVSVVGAYADGKQALEGILAQRPDLVILDVEMPLMRGDEVIRAMRAQGLLHTKAILVSASDLRQQFSQLCDGYLLKPLCPYTLMDFIRSSAHPQADFSLCLTSSQCGEKNTVEYSAASSNDVVRVKNGEHWRKVPHHQINWVEEAGDYVCLHTLRESVVGRHSLLGVERQLNPKSFCRISSSIIINLNHMNCASTGASGELLVSLKSGDRFRVDNAYRCRFQQLAT
ncbi:LytR/AlgR family response regulator transcription factor [Bowmanella pacifica]|uniref:Response regulatory domain-containing protein n=1 Tax=Bowmanella pacifica TaxID=502051 RepID=A0A917YSS0_9ALTE|nr:response regulator [Bowmanella pacifica]GGO64576.1 hypothetical protein GCM10010982_04340 [Bowmanella pacifica]